MLSGAIEPEEACSTGAKWYMRSGYDPGFTVPDWTGLDDEYGTIGRDGRTYLGSTRADLDDIVRVEARKITDEPDAAG